MVAAPPLTSCHPALYPVSVFAWLCNVNVGNDVNIGRDANVTNNLTVKRKTLLGEAVNDTTHIMGESYHNENSFFNKNVKVLES